MSTTPEETAAGRWYDGVTRYQWLVLAIASAGWVFDVFEGQLFAIYKTPAMADVLDVDSKDELVDRYSNYAFASFLVGGALGGLVFGILADRIGRRQTMVVSILFYSIFTGMHYFATTWWHIVGLRFLVAMGVGGEWAIAASLVSEVFPKRARAAAGGIFHASSVLGAVFASLCGMFLSDTDWRTAFLIGLVPALLIVWIRASLKESERWEGIRKTAADNRADAKMGSVSELLTDSRWKWRALLGLGLASIGLGTYWGIYAWGPELVREVLTERVDQVEGDELRTLLSESLSAQVDEPEEKSLVQMIRLASEKLRAGGNEDSAGLLESVIPEVEDAEAGTLSDAKIREILKSPAGNQYRGSKASFAYLLMNFTGGLMGLLLFAPTAAKFGRRAAFAIYHVGAIATAPATFLLADSYEATLFLLPVMAFFVVGMHAGYAIYFPELFPTRLRATGASFCFNVARLVSAGMLLLRAELREMLGLRQAVSVMALLFAVGLVILIFAPETKDQELED